MKIPEKTLVISWIEWYIKTERRKDRCGDRPFQGGIPQRLRTRDWFLIYWPSGEIASAGIAACPLFSESEDYYDGFDRSNLSCFRSMAGCGLSYNYGTDCKR